MHLHVYSYTTVLMGHECTQQLGIIIIICTKVTCVVHPKSTNYCLTLLSCFSSLVNQTVFLSLSPRPLYQREKRSGSRDYCFSPLPILLVTRTACSTIRHTTCKATYCTLSVKHYVYAYSNSARTTPIGSST